MELSEATFTIRVPPGMLQVLLKLCPCEPVFGATLPKMLTPPVTLNNSLQINSYGKRFSLWPCDCFVCFEPEDAGTEVKVMVKAITGGSVAAAFGLQISSNHGGNLAELKLYGRQNSPRNRQGIKLTACYADFVCTEKRSHESVSGPFALPSHPFPTLRECIYCTGKNAAETMTFKPLKLSSSMDTNKYGQGAVPRGRRDQELAERKDNKEKELSQGEYRRDHKLSQWEDDSDKELSQWEDSNEKGMSQWGHDNDRELFHKEDNSDKGMSQQEYRRDQELSQGEGDKDVSQGADKNDEELSQEE
ncbi:hypothetical protein WISP_41843 [Willisornis vidua]|uniref:Uncharacterized protein n=1 Tax=Willisornis vidua TaxID=1566151 RepID=A0ABQ9DHX8_9PASS|nr:hypothetical protein WISP_41843 [Willisornis vidua]